MSLKDDGCWLIGRLISLIRQVLAVQGLGYG